MEGTCGKKGGNKRAVTDIKEKKKKEQSVSIETHALKQHTCNMYPYRKPSLNVMDQRNTTVLPQTAVNHSPSDFVVVAFSNVDAFGNVFFRQPQLGFFFGFATRGLSLTRFQRFRGIFQDCFYVQCFFFDQSLATFRFFFQACDLKR
jgi:hypothetical protein